MLCVLVDVIGYNADLVANHQRSAVWRIGWNMRLGSSSDVIFPPGGFEFKVRAPETGIFCLIFIVYCFLKIFFCKSQVCEGDLL